MLRCSEMYETENSNKYILLTQIYAAACLMKWMGVEHVQRGKGGSNGEREAAKCLDCFTAKCFDQKFAAFDGKTRHVLGRWH